MDSYVFVIHFRTSSSNDLTQMLESFMMCEEPFNIDSGNELYKKLAETPNIIIKEFHFASNEEINEFVPMYKLVYYRNFKYNLITLDSGIPVMTHEFSKILWFKESYKRKQKQHPILIATPFNAHGIHIINNSKSKVEEF